MCLWLLWLRKHLRLTPAASQPCADAIRVACALSFLSALLPLSLSPAPIGSSGLSQGFRRAAAQARSPSRSTHGFRRPPYTGQPPHAIGTEPTGRAAGSAHRGPARQHAYPARARGSDGAESRPCGRAPDGKLKFAQSDAGYEAKLTLKQDSACQRAHGWAHAWRLAFQIVPDKRAHHRLYRTPTRRRRGNAEARLSRPADDYGVVKSRSAHRAGRRTSAQHENATRPKDGTLVVESAVAAANETIFDRPFHRDLTSHPYAGMKVAIRLAATDAAGQTRMTAPIIP